MIVYPVGTPPEWQDKDVEADFQALDTNRDRRVTLDEIFNRVERMDSPYPIERMMETARELLADMDRDKDQAVPLAEYLDYRWAIYPGSKDSRVHSSRRLNVPVPYDPAARDWDDEDAFPWELHQDPPRFRPSIHGIVECIYATHIRLAARLASAWPARRAALARALPPAAAALDAALGAARAAAAALRHVWRALIAPLRPRSPGRETVVDRSGWGPRDLSIIWRHPLCSTPHECQACPPTPPHPTLLHS